MENIINNDEMLDTLVDSISERLLQKLSRLQHKKRWLSMSEAVDYTGRTRNTVKRWIDEGYINAQKTTGHWKIDRESIDDWFQSDEEI